VRVPPGKPFRSYLVDILHEWTSGPPADLVISFDEANVLYPGALQAWFTRLRAYNWSISINSDKCFFVHDSGKLGYWEGGITTVAFYWNGTDWKQDRLPNHQENLQPDWRNSSVTVLHAVGEGANPSSGTISDLQQICEGSTVQIDRDLILSFEEAAALDIEAVRAFFQAHVSGHFYLSNNGFLCFNGQDTFGYVDLWNTKEKRWTHDYPSDDDRRISSASEALKMMRSPRK
jgi:hypothetical protein